MNSVKNQAIFSPGYSLEGISPGRRGSDISAAHSKIINSFWGYCAVFDVVSAGKNKTLVGMNMFLVRSTL